MNKYIITYFCGFGSNGRFEVETVEYGTWDEVYAHACVAKNRRDSTFNRCHFDIIELENTDQIKERRRKLTWKERIMGRMNE